MKRKQSKSKGLVGQARGNTRKRTLGFRRPATHATKLPKTKQKVAKVISRMRSRRTSLRKASREIGVSPRTVIRRAASALKKNESGRYSATPLLVPTPEGPRAIAVRNSNDASQLSRYWSSLHRYFETGEVSHLRKFTGQFITDVNREKHPLITDLEVLNRLGSAGAVSFESIYSWSAQ